MIKSGGMYAVQKINQLKLQRGNLCEWEECINKENLEWAHKLPTYLAGKGRGSWNRLKDIQTYPFSYFLLCKDHHKEFDNTYD